jgi:hypothetical protein
MRPGELFPESRPMNSLLMRPSAWIPVVMSLIGLSLVLGHLAVVGIVHEADEGTLAHLWQLLMAGQVPVIAFFAFKWLPRNPRQAVLVLALQAGAAIASFASVFLFTA